MKRCMSAKSMTAAALVSLMALSGCKSEDDQVGGQRAAGSDWQRPPTVESARWNGLRVALSGVAEPSGRVVLSSAEGTVFAANADRDGKFTIELDAPSTGIALKPKAQLGQTFIDGQGVLYLVPGDAPLAVTVLDGEASQRLGKSGPLDSVDTDGVVLILSGRTTSNAAPKVRIGQETYSPRPDREGRWILAATGGASATDIAVGDRSYDFPGVGRLESPPQIVGGGWLLTRNLGGKAVQTTWLPADM